MRSIHQKSTVLKTASTGRLLDTEVNIVVEEYRERILGRHLILGSKMTPLLLCLKGVSFWLMFVKSVGSRKGRSTFVESNDRRRVN